MGVEFSEVGGICEYVGLIPSPIPKTSHDRVNINCRFWYGIHLADVPLVFEKDGFRFAFYSNDHKPIHVHVRKAGAEAIFDVEESVELRESQGFKIKDLNRAQQLAEENRDLIIEKWYEHLG